MWCDVNTALLNECLRRKQVRVFYPSSHPRAVPVSLSIINSNSNDDKKTTKKTYIFMCWYKCDATYCVNTKSHQNEASQWNTTKTVTNPQHDFFGKATCWKKINPFQWKVTVLNLVVVVIYFFKRKNIYIYFILMNIVEFWGFNQCHKKWLITVLWSKRENSSRKLIL